MSDMPLGPAPRWVGAAASIIQRLPAGRYRAMNWVAARGADPFWARMPADLGGALFRCDLRDPLMREVCLTGRYEPQETTLLQQLLEPGMTCVDVGANWGYFALVAAHLVGPDGRVVAVEADPRACRTLRANAARNHLDHISVVEAAASDRPGTIGLQAYGHGADDLSNFGLTSTTTIIAGGSRFEVAARPLDAVLDQVGIERVDVLKMDIEGAEARALAGLERRLSASAIDRIVLELHPAHLRDQGSSVDAVVSLLRGHGYAAWRIDHSPDAYRWAAQMRGGRETPASLLAPYRDGDHLGEWPHLLWTRTGLEPRA